MEEICVLIRKGIQCPFFVQKTDERISSRLGDGSWGVSSVLSFLPLPTAGPEPNRVLGRQAGLAE
jgi:hypothetical protein